MTYFVLSIDCVDVAFILEKTLCDAVESLLPLPDYTFVRVRGSINHNEYQSVLPNGEVWKICNHFCKSGGNLLLNLLIKKGEIV